MQRILELQVVETVVETEVLSPEAGEFAHDSQVSLLACEDFGSTASLLLCA